MCGYENTFRSDEIRHVVELEDRLSDETVTGLFAECGECGERVELESPDALPPSSPVETALAFLAIAGMGLILLVVLWKLTQ